MWAVDKTSPTTCCQHSPSYTQQLGLSLLLDWNQISCLVTDNRLWEMQPSNPHDAPMCLPLHKRTVANAVPSKNWHHKVTGKLSQLQTIKQCFSVKTRQSNITDFAPVHNLLLLYAMTNYTKSNSVVPFGKYVGNLDIQTCWFQPPCWGGGSK